MPIFGLLALILAVKVNFIGCLRENRLAIQIGVQVIRQIHTSVTTNSMRIVSS